MRRVFYAAVVAALLVVPGQARAADVAVGAGIVVADLSADEVRWVLDAADGAAAFARLVAPALPPEYHAAVRLAAGGWVALRPLLPEPAGVRVILTLDPPAMSIVPPVGPTASELVRAHVAGRGRGAEPVRSAFRQAGATLEAVHHRLAARWFDRPAPADAGRP
jgi:hypothetical protein